MSAAALCLHRGDWSGTEILQQTHQSTVLLKKSFLTGQKDVSYYVLVRLLCLEYILVLQSRWTSMFTRGPLRCSLIMLLFAIDRNIRLLHFTPEDAGQRLARADGCRRILRLRRARRTCHNSCPRDAASAFYKRAINQGCLHVTAATQDVEQSSPSAPPLFCLLHLKENSDMLNIESPFWFV